MEVKAIRNNYNCIDLTRFICEILVLCVHFINDYGDNNIKTR